jgi:hypothetical protein
MSTHIHTPSIIASHARQPRVTRNERQGGDPSAEPTSAPERSLGLAFEQRGGPLLALVGVCGGAGTTTLAYLLAAGAAIESRQPVLLADLGGPAAGVCAYASVQSGQSFPIVAEHVANGRRPPRALFATGEFGMRVLAARPELDSPVSAESATTVLSHAQAAHALTVVDCGSLTRPVEQITLDLATHVAWVLPATSVGARRAETLLATLNRFVPGHEIVVARNDHGAQSAPLARLAEIADDRGAPLVLVPRLDDLLDADTEAVLEQAGVALQALGGLLRR